MTKRITINPITRLEGHGSISIFLDDKGNVERTYLQVPELRGFEKFCEGRAVEEMPALTQKSCGVCPTAHHIASGKALDNLFKVEPPEAAKKLRELMHNAFIFEDHLLHFYFLGGTDFLVGLDAPKKKRNIFGVGDKLGSEIVKRVIDIRKRARELNAMISGSPLYPVCCLPGGISKSLTEQERSYIKSITNDALEFIKFAAKDYLKYLEERVEPWSYMKTLYLKGVGWKGFIDGKKSGIYRVGPLARLNASEGMATPLAQAEYDKMFNMLGGKPAHNTLAYHWARLIEVLYAAERMVELAENPELTDPFVRNIPAKPPREGVGVWRAPRGTLLH